MNIRLAGLISVGTGAGMLSLIGPALIWFGRRREMSRAIAAGTRKNKESPRRERGYAEGVRVPQGV
jgi:hypothetical protein